MLENSAVFCGRTDWLLCRYGLSRYGLSHSNQHAQNDKMDDDDDDDDDDGGFTNTCDSV